MNRLSIGSANFGMNYGICNNLQLNENEIHRILETCKDENIEYIDTAIDYGNAHQTLSECLRKGHKFKISTKIPSIDKLKKYPSIEESCEEILIKSINSLKVDYLDSLFIHNPQDLIKPEISKLIKWMKFTKERGFIKKVGISIYYDSILSAIDLKDIDIIQLPLSLYDKRFRSTGIINKLKELNIEIQIRSIFLQGLIIRDYSSWPTWIQKNDLEEHKRYLDFLKRNETNSFEQTFAFIKNPKDIDYCVVGVSSKEELDEIIKYWKIKSNKVEISPQLNFSTQFLDPRKWPK